MKKLILTASLMVLAGGARAQQAGQLGAGVIVGDPIGVTGKVWLDHATALDFGLGGSEGDFAAWADFLVHGWDILPKPASGKFALYAAGGAKIVNHDSTELGIRALGGICYWVENHPIEIFLEAGPVFDVSGNDTGVDIDGGLGVRFYFAGGKK